MNWKKKLLNLLELNKVVKIYRKIQIAKWKKEEISFVIYISNEFLQINLVRNNVGLI